MDVRAHRRAWYHAARALLPGGVEVWDAHCHTGEVDPDGVKGTAADLLSRLQRAGHSGAVVMSSRDPGGYPPANDRVLAEAQAAAGRFLPFLRVDPHDPGALAEAERSFAAGHVGLKLHPRGEAFTLGHPVVQDLARMAAARRAPVLVHSGRGIPPLRADLLRLLESAPGLVVILAHCAISDLAALGPEAAGLPGVYFDTAWWDVTDVIALFAWVPSGRILYASDTPYGRPADAFVRTMRVAASAGLDDAALAGVFGNTLLALVGGGDLPPDGAPAPAGFPAVDPGLLRVHASLHGAAVDLFAGRDASEAVSLARAGCRVGSATEHSAVYEAIGAGLDAAAGGEGRRATLGLLLTLAAVALTPGAGLPDGYIPGA